MPSSHRGANSISKQGKAHSHTHTFARIVVPCSGVQPHLPHQADTWTPTHKSTNLLSLQLLLQLLDIAVPDLPVQRIFRLYFVQNLHPRSCCGAAVVYVCFCESKKLLAALSGNKKKKHAQQKTTNLTVWPNVNNSDPLISHYLLRSFKLR